MIEPSPVVVIVNSIAITLLGTLIPLVLATMAAYAFAWIKFRGANVLFIFADDLTMQAISAYRHPLKLLQTPNLDRIATEGAVFRNSFCAARI